MNEDSEAGWHQDSRGSELPLWPDRDVVAPESRGVVRFVLWSEVLAEAFGFQSWSEMATATFTLPEESRCRVHAVRSGVDGQVPSVAVEAYNGMVRQLPMDEPTFRG